MTDTLSSEARSARMSRIRARNTKPELAVRRLLHAEGYSYRVHATVLPGKPDIVLRNRYKAIFVHGCFWHRHPDPACRLARMPKSRLELWAPKLEENRARDVANVERLEAMGWDVLLV